MIYMSAVTTPANTQSSSPLLTRLSVTKGLIYKFQFYMPSGALGYHHLQVFDGSLQLWPSTTGESFVGDDLNVFFDDLYSKQVEPYELQIRTWNLDDTYTHTVSVYIGLVSEESFMMRFLPGLTYEKMLEVLDALKRKEEETRAAALVSPLTWFTR